MEEPGTPDAFNEKAAYDIKTTPLSEKFIVTTIKRYAMSYGNSSGLAYNPHQKKAKRNTNKIVKKKKRKK